MAGRALIRPLIHINLDYDDEYEDEGEEEEEGDDDDDGEETEEGEEDQDYVPEVQSPRVSQTGPSSSAQAGFVPEPSRNWVDEEGDKRRRNEGGEASSSNGIGSLEGSQGGEWNRGEIDGLFCPICMEAWTNSGTHHICCLPCGHIYGMSCINKWLKQQRGSGKCPQCNRKCLLKDVRKLFASRIVTVDEESQKRIRSLEAKCASLEKKGSDWSKKEAEWRNRETELHLKVGQLTERATYLERLLEEFQSKPFVVNHGKEYKGRSASDHNFSTTFCKQGYSRGFILEKELLVDGGRLFDVNASSQIILVARRQSGMGLTHYLTKISMLAPHEREEILLPSCIKAIRDLHISPSTSDLAVFASLGKKLAVLSMESSNIVLSYDLPDAAWSCSWDLNSSHYVYAGLKNGSLLVFDMRQTVGPLKTLSGLTSNPVHTIHSLSNDPTGGRTCLSASGFGICQWNIDAAEVGPFLVPESYNQGVCISAAYCPSSDDVVASYRPKVGVSNETTVSQPSLTPSPVIGQGVDGSHVLFKKLGNNFQKLSSVSATVDGLRLPMSTIIDIEDHNRMLATGDDVMGELILQELPSFTVLRRLKLQKHPVHDLKFTCAGNRGFLCCLSGDNLQLFHTKSF